ncbi:MAG: hypothetical protein NC131_08315 [Roseburia sp.]|nr:hypothetical protein [Roseburia sp.]
MNTEKTESPVEGQNEQTTQERDCLEILVDNDYVSVPRGHYEKLVEARVKLEIVARVARSEKSYAIGDTVKLVLGLDDEGDTHA